MSSDRYFRPCYLLNQHCSMSEPQQPSSPARSETQPLLNEQHNPQVQQSPSRGGYQSSVYSQTHNGEPPRQPQFGKPYSPLNSMYVRMYRYVLLLLLALVLIWFVLLIFDAFKWIGATDPRGSGFEVVAVVLLSSISLAIAVFFYSIPSKVDQVIGYLTSIILLVDVVMVLSVPELRHRIGISPGVFAFLFALLVFSASAFSNSVVMWAKQAEEIRLYGRYDDRKTLTEWFEVFFFNALRIVLFVGVIILSANLAIEAADSNLPPLGQLVPVTYSDIDINVHVACTPAGAKGPLVVVEAGEYGAEESARWTLKAEKVSAVCYWDRPGWGFSDNAPSPLAVGDTVDMLITALQHARPSFQNESVILVSTGVGSLYSRVLASRLDAKQVKGLMMVDGEHEELFYDTFEVAKSVWYLIKGITAPFRWSKISSVLSAYGPEDRIYGRLEKKGARFQKAKMQQLASAARQSRRDIGDATLGLPPHIPLLVVSSSERCEDQQWATYQRLLLKLSDNVLAWKIIEGPKDLWRNSKASKQLSDLLTSLATYV